LQITKFTRHNGVLASDTFELT